MVAGTPVAQGAHRDFIIKKEATFGVAPSTDAARVLRRTQGVLNLRKETIQSAEKRADFQVADSRHGTQRVEGNMSQELSNGSSTELFELLMMRDFAAVATINAGATDAQIAATSSVISRGASSFATDGIRVGMVVRFTGMGTNAANRNWLVTAMAVDGLSFTVAPVDGGAALADWAADSTGTIVIPGKRTYIPLTGHTSQSLCIEESNRRLDVSKINTGVKVSSLGIRVSPNGMVTLEWGLIGLDQSEVSGSEAPFYVSPTGPGVGRTMASTAGIIVVGGTVQAVLTGLQLDLANGASTLPVIFSKTSPDIPLGRALTVRGQMTAAVKDRTFNAALRNESEVRVSVVLEAPNPGGAPHFMAIDLGRVKINTQDEDDPDGPIMETVGIEALLASAATGIDATTIAIQDSSLA